MVGLYLRAFFAFGLTCSINGWSYFPYSNLVLLYMEFWMNITYLDTGGSLHSRRRFFRPNRSTSPVVPKPLSSCPWEHGKNGERFAATVRLDYSMILEYPERSISQPTGYLSQSMPRFPGITPERIMYSTSDKCFCCSRTPRFLESRWTYFWLGVSTHESTSQIARSLIFICLCISFVTSVTTLPPNILGCFSGVWSVRPDSFRRRWKMTAPRGGRAEDEISVISVV